MDTNTLIQLATLISVVAGVVGLLISVRAYKRQVSAQFLLEYTRRIDEIMLSLPPSVWAAHLFPDAELPEQSVELSQGVLRCLSLFAQLHFFCRNGYIPKQVWRKSKGQFAQTLRSPLFMREWQTLAPVFATDRVFTRYVERVQQGAEVKAQSAAAPPNNLFQPTPR